MRVLLLGSGFLANLRTNLKKIQDIEILEYSSLDIEAVLSLGTPFEMPMIFLGNTPGITKDDLLELNTSGYVLIFVQEHSAVLNSIGPSISFSVLGHFYTFSSLSIKPNSYFYELNTPLNTISVYEGYSSYHLSPHPSVETILYLSVDKISIGVISNLDTSLGVFPTPMLYANILNTIDTSVGSNTIFKDVILFAKKYSKPPYAIYGSVYDVNKNPISRKIAVYDASNCRLLNSGLSSPEDGSYKITLTKNVLTYVVALPELGGNALVKYGVVPEENE